MNSRAEKKTDEPRIDDRFFELACATLKSEDFKDQKTLNTTIQKRIKMLYAAYTEWKKKQPHVLKNFLEKACVDE